MRRPETDTLSVVIVNWNAGRALDDCLDALFASESIGALEVLLVDNASTDGSQVRAVQAHPGIKLLQNAENRGFACGANQGLERVVGDLMLLLNPDVVLSPSAISVLADFMNQHPDTAIVGPKLLNPDGTVQGSARRDPSLRTGLFGRDAPLTRLFPNNPVTHREVPSLCHVGDAPLEVDWVSGAWSAGASCGLRARRKPGRAVLPLLGGCRLVPSLSRSRLEGLLPAGRRGDSRCWGSAEPSGHSGPPWTSTGVRTDSTGSTTSPLRFIR